MEGGTFNGAPATLPVLPRPAPRTPHMLGRCSRLACLGLLRFGAAPLARRGSARRGARGYTTPASGWLLCTGSGARALLRWVCALVMRSAGLVAAGEGGHGVLAGRCSTVLPLASELPYPRRRAPRRFPVVRATRERCGACPGVPGVRRGFYCDI